MPSEAGGVSYLVVQLGLPLIYSWFSCRLVCPSNHLPGFTASPNFTMLEYYKANWVACLVFIRHRRLGRAFVTGREFDFMDIGLMSHKPLLSRPYQGMRRQVSAHRCSMCRLLMMDIDQNANTGMNVNFDVYDMY